MAWPADFDLGTIEYRLWPKIQITATCWGWLAKKTRDGYGQIGILGKHQLAHRVVYTLLKGPIPKGLTLDHLCRNRSCVNPDHLEAVPMKINVHRGDSPWGKNAQKTECLHGHPLTGDNLSLDKNGGRHCVACDSIREIFQIQKRKLKSPNRLIANKMKTHCIHGHEFSGANLMIEKDGRRRCLTCQRVRSRMKETPERRIKHAEYRRTHKEQTATYDRSRNLKKKEERLQTIMEVPSGRIEGNAKGVLRQGVVADEGR